MPKSKGGEGGAERLVYRQGLSLACFACYKNYLCGEYFRVQPLNSGLSRARCGFHSRSYRIYLINKYLPYSYRVL